MLLLWSSLASIFLALNIIGYGVETDSYFYVFISILILAYVYASYTPEPCSLRKKFTFVFGLFVCLAFVITSCGRPESFIFWKMQNISRKQWMKMAADLRALARKKPEFGDSNYYPRDLTIQLPKSFDRLGLKEDYCIFYTGSEPCVIYGCQGAEGCHWGLMIGTEHLKDRRYPKLVKRYPVAKDVYFFYDPN